MINNSQDQSRIDKAKEIANNPDNYKVCEGCDSIVGAGANICPNCHSYRFDGDSSRVVDQAVWLGYREQKSVTAEDLYWLLDDHHHLKATQQRWYGQQIL